MLQQKRGGDRRRAPTTNDNELPVGWTRLLHYDQRSDSKTTPSISQLQLGATAMNQEPL
jgi:hypothetical protein